ncbi:hypothetical protein SAMN06265338_106210 [Rhodoblastus acidophilus]|uniref:Flagellar assembly protein FliH/Type III secretion system HrpE domain-containing protein n=1 Tax=Rhodoblastus acidophilus TaxID=1074 RepID=A0A212RS22_RHOAC|nr:hypothetical protein [Rhodoblastus acidophilus]MCW2316274.1 hypothetical protein [Rhodoblastus acidophilus]PPQ38611.1 hypothetical protein CKO16_10010 [Rhodoblastus acidophilus]RAI19760.1 hypothetical protein CH337_11055 [Rhodoblastus acidophilus]SNB75294.1 hypothetical protein SAMN06265338_106210 [Rhodoblastus acidophilus]
MKPVPFAEYLARQQAAATPEPPEPPAPSWPPPRKRSADEKPARQSPLLRRPEAPEVRRDVRQDGRQEPRFAEPRPAPSPAHKLEQTLLKAFEEGREAARHELVEERARLREQIEAQAAQERAKWAMTEGERLFEAHRAAFADFEQRCAQSVANILRPFLTQSVITRVTDELVRNLEVLFASRTHALFEISGPSDLLDALKAKFEGRSASIAYALSDSIDVRVRVEDTIIETQLAAWMQALGALPSDAEQGSGS